MEGDSGDKSESGIRSRVKGDSRDRSRVGVEGGSKVQIESQNTGRQIKEWAVGLALDCALPSVTLEWW